jgi:hypothetical protein
MWQPPWTFCIVNMLSYLPHELEPSACPLLPHLMAHSSSSQQATPHLHLYQCRPLHLLLLPHWGPAAAPALHSLLLLLPRFELSCPSTMLLLAGSF